jgi:hypothetical protein
LGGPQKPDMMGMTAAEEEAAKEAIQKVKEVIH